MLPLTRKNKVETKIMGINISRFPPHTQLLLCSFGVFATFLIYAYLQEYIFTIPGFKFGWYLTLIQFLIYSFFSAMERISTSEIYIRKSPLTPYGVVAVFMVITMGLSHTACMYLNYPTQVVFKSSKLIPVMIGGKFILKRKFAYVEYLSAIFLIWGLCIMTLGDLSVSPQFNFTGIILICGSLVSDAFISNLQEKILRDYDSNHIEMVFYSYSIGCFYLIFFLLLTGELFSAMSFCWNHPFTYFIMFTYGFFGYFGTNFVLALIHMFDAFVAMTVTTCRKIVTIALSFLLFPKPFSIQYIIAGSLVFSGVSLQIFHKNTLIFYHYIYKLTGIDLNRKKALQAINYKVV